MNAADPKLSVESCRIMLVKFGMKADTYLSNSGTVTVTILVDGNVLKTDSVTASGKPDSVTITGYVPD